MTRVISYDKFYWTIKAVKYHFLLRWYCSKLFCPSIFVYYCDCVLEDKILDISFSSVAIQRVPCLSGPATLLKMWDSLMESFSTTLSLFFYNRFRTELWEEKKCLWFPQNKMIGILTETVEGGRSQCPPKVDSFLLASLRSLVWGNSYMMWKICILISAD